MPRFLFIGAPIALVAGFVAFGARDDVRPRKTTSSVHHMPLGSVRVTMPSLERGVEHAYDVSLVQTVTPKGGEAVRVAVTGTWAVTYAGSDATGAVFRAELRNAKPTVRRGTVDIAMPASDFVRPYYFTTSDEGRLLALQFSPGMQELARGALTSLATLGQRSAIASDTLGDYEATYAEDASGIHRTRVRYARVTGGDAIKVTIDETGTDFALRADGWPNAIRGREVTTVGNGDMTVVGQQEFELRHTATATIDPGWPEGLEVSAVDAATASARAQELEDRDLAGDANFADLMAELAKITDTHARGYQFLRLAALMRLDPKVIDEAVRAVAANAPDSDVVVGALGEAGTPQAQRALVGLLDTGRIDDEHRVQAAVALGLTGSPTSATLDSLAQLSQAHDEVGDTALLAYGNATLRASDEDPSDAARRVDDLLARLARATDDEERAVLLRALGNTGDPRILPALSTYVAVPSVLVRTAAVEALRLVPGDEAMIISALADGVLDVRAAAVFAAANHDMNALRPALARALQRDREDSIRRAIIELAADSPLLRPLLVDASAHDPDPELRALAKRLLDESGSA
jgi:hypothetical protein